MRYFIGILFSALLISGCDKAADATTAPPAIAEEPALIAAALPPITVYRSPTCQCCEKWIAHLEESGLTVIDEISMNLAAIKGQVGVPRKMTSCHTAFIGDYIIEGHVPAADIKRLLLEKPDINGLAVPKMPIGSPGMEFEDRQDPYAVLGFKTDSDKLIVFNQYPAAE